MKVRSISFARTVCCLMSVVCCLTIASQPAKRRVVSSNAAANPTSSSSRSASGNDRAALQFPTSSSMPEDVVWKRDIYRQLDLMKDKNAPMYYPVEPVGRQVNLFTYIFRLILTGRVAAYTYKLDGNESFEEKNRMAVKDMLDRFYILYDEDASGKITVADVDVPSAEVTRYYVKESVYLDQRTGTFSTRVTALCPILMRSDDNMGDGAEAVAFPLFWVKYDDVASYLARLPMMGSNLNNVSNMTADDFFTMHHYDGKIYKTNNLQGRVLANYCETDSAMNAEQQKIEKQLTDFEAGVWGRREAPADSTATPEETGKKGKSVARPDEKKDVEAPAASNSRRRVGRTSSSSKSSGSAPSISARRQRR